jgi:hypothetical protein
MILNNVLLVFLSLIYDYVQSSHFYGGSLSARPLIDQGTTVMLEFTIRFAYRRSYTNQTFCDDNTIRNNILFGPNFAITCDINCITKGEVIGTTSIYCVAYSMQEDWSYGTKSFMTRALKKNQYEVNYVGGD